MLRISLKTSLVIISLFLGLALNAQNGQVKWVSKSQDYGTIKEEDKKRLQNAHAKKLDAAEENWIKEMMQKHQCIEESFALAQKLSNEAMLAVEDDKALVEILETMIKRSY